jgi:nucleoside-diphosphate-sugar epimerase
VEQLPEIKGEIDYIIHGANPTASRYFIEHPVETIHTAVYGTDNLLRLARDKKVKGFVYLSLMEVYIPAMNWQTGNRLPSNGNLHEH